MRETLKKAAIVGVYQTEQGRSLGRSASDLYIEAVKGVLEDAGINIGEVDGLIASNHALAEGEGRAFPASAFAESFGTQLRYIQHVTAGSQSAALGVLHAVEAVAMGRAHTVLVPAWSVQERTGGAGRDQWDSPFGMPIVASYGMIARRHMHEYGTTSAQLAQVAVIARKHAVLNPAAIMGGRGPITVEDVVNSRMIYDPIHLLDCCLISEGAGAVLVTTEEHAKNLKHSPVHVLGLADSFSHIGLYDLPSLTTFPDANSTTKEAFGMAGVNLSDVDVAQISDHFTINVIIALEDLGFCKKGEGGAFVESGALELGGTMPMNTNGGYLSHAHNESVGIYNIIELVQQLRGEAGERQVPNAEIGMYHGIGGMFNSAHTAILARG